MEFMDSFKRLDNLCSQIYGNDAGSGKYVSGVAMYMNEMRKCGADTEYRVPGWDTYYDRLKHYLTLRNSICHDDGVDEAGLFACGRLSENDVRRLEDFCDAMLEGRDPIALYYKKRRAVREAARNANRSAKSAAPAAKAQIAAAWKSESVSVNTEHAAKIQPDITPESKAATKAHETVIATPAAKAEAEPCRRETISAPQPSELPDGAMRMYNESLARKRRVKIVIAVAAALLGALAVAAGFLLAYGML